MTLEQGKLSRLGDTKITKENLINGKALVYNETEGVWQPEDILGGGDGPLGMPTDGDWSDGAIDFDAEDKVVDAIDDLNEVLGELVPANALSIQNVNLSTSNEKTSAKIINGLGDEWEGVMGTSRSDISNKESHNLVLSNSSNAFNNADKGVLKLYINGTLKSKIDLEANFKESNRKDNQDIKTYVNKGKGDELVEGVATFDTGKFKITAVGKYNNFSKWQKGNAVVELTSALPGKNQYQIGHEINGNEIKSKATIFYFDNNDLDPEFRVMPTLGVKNCAGKFLSGVKYYTTGDTFNISYTVDNVFKTTYHNTEVSAYSMPGVNRVIKNPIGVPNMGDQLEVNEVVTINQTGVMVNNAALSVLVNNSFEKKIDKAFPANRLILTVGNVSTKTKELFKDEQYRLPTTFDFEDKTASLVGNWNSEDALLDGDAQVFFSGTTPALVYPQAFVSGIMPIQTVDYSEFTGDQVYIRGFEGANKGSVPVTLTGLSNLSDVKIEIKLPGMSGWGNALLPYDSAADKTKDGWGMLQGSATKTGFTATFGGFNTADTNGRIYLKITLLNQNAKLNGVSVGW